MMARRTAVLLAAVVVVAGVLGAFQVASATGEPPTGSIVIVKKHAYGDASTSWTWTIQKWADHSSLILSPGQSFPVNYEVQVQATGQSGTWSVWGDITFVNSTELPVIVTSVVDQLSDGTFPSLTCDIPTPLDPGNAGTCAYSASGDGEAPTSNTATVYVDDGSGGAVVGGTVTETIAYGAGTVTDECVDVTDSYGGSLGTVCAGEQTTFTFTYQRTIGPYEACGSYTVPNTAAFTTNDSGSTGSSSWTIDVSVPCEGGCSLTPGYWKTHSIYGPAPYDDTWAMLGEDTPFFTSGLSYYQVLWTSPSGGNAYYILAHAYIAAVLNDLNGADTSAVTSQLAHAAVLFGSYTPTSMLPRIVRADFINTASILDQYNNGLIGPGHCSE
jgi:hypothetical protein